MGFFSGLLGLGGISGCLGDKEREGEFGGRGQKRFSSPIGGGGARGAGYSLSWFGTGNQGIELLQL